MIKTILFDLDDTLLDFKDAERHALAATLSHFGIEPTEEIIVRYGEINESCWRRLETGELTHSEVKTERYRILFEETSVSADPSAATGFYESRIPFEHKTVSGAEETLRRLFPKYTLIAASNGTGETQRKRLRDSGLDKYFTDIFISSEVGFTKPRPEFFDEIFRRHPELRREETAIVGDSLTSDVAGGVFAGIMTVWYNRKGKDGLPEPVPDLIVRSLDELKTVF